MQFRMIVHAKSHFQKYIVKILNFKINLVVVLTGLYLFAFASYPQKNQFSIDIILIFSNRRERERERGERNGVC